MTVELSLLTPNAPGGKSILVNEIKFHNTEFNMVLDKDTPNQLADRTVQIRGGTGYIADYDIERFYREVRLFRICEEPPRSGNWSLPAT